MTEKTLVPHSWKVKLVTYTGVPYQLTAKILDWITELYAYGNCDPSDPEFVDDNLRLSYNYVADKFDITYYDVHRVLAVLESAGVLERDIRHFAKGVRRTFINLTPEFLESVNWEEGDEHKNRVISFKEARG